MGDTGNVNGGPPRADHNLVATYADPERARSAIEALERKGIEAGNITLFGESTQQRGGAPVTNDEQRDADLAATGAVGRRALVGVLVGVLVGAVIGAVGGLVAYEFFDVGPNAALNAIGGAVAFGGIGAYAGGYWGGASKLPVSNDAWGDTFIDLRGGETCVAVHSADASQVETAERALTGTQASKIVRYGRDGKAHQVA